MNDKRKFSCVLNLLQGIVGSGVVFLIIAWCIQMRGPLFASVFNPLMLVLVAVAASLMLDEHLYLGRYTLKPNSSKYELTLSVSFCLFFWGFGPSTYIDDLVWFGL